MMMQAAYPWSNADISQKIVDLLTRIEASLTVRIVGVSTTNAAGETVAQAVTLDGQPIQVILAASIPAGGSNIGVVDTELAAAILSADGMANPTVPQTLSDCYVYNGSTWDRFRLKQVDFDTGGGTENLHMVGIALPASGGAVAGGTSTNPVRVDPTGTTTQPTKEVRSTTGTVTSTSDNASNVTLLAANANRLGAIVQNTSSGILYVKCGATATTTSFTVRLAQFGYWECPFGYTGIIDAIWATDPNDGAAVVTEFT